MTRREIEEVISCAAREVEGFHPPAWKKTAAQYSAPALYGFCDWVIEQAHRAGQKRLYFLARDGYLLREISDALAQARGYEIECRYLYASRLAWRLPAWHLIGKEETIQQIFSRAYGAAPRAVFARMRASEEECRRFAAAAGIAFSALDQVISPAALRRMELILRNDVEFMRVLMKKSREAYAPAVEYFRQEGLLDGNPVVLVDTGWTGSMQRTLRQLLESAGFHAELSGYYFGLYQSPAEEKDGVYRAWYFDRESPARVKAKFNNNVLESMLPAPHPMTAGYAYQEKKVVPVWNDRKNAGWRPVYEKTVLEVCRKLDSALFSQDGQKLLDCVRRRMEKLCFAPGREEVLGLSGCFFSDDMSEACLRPLAGAVTQEEAERYAFFRRFQNRKRTDGTAQAELFWPYGSFALSPIRFRQWYRMNVYLWDWLRFSRM